MDNNDNGKENKDTEDKKWGCFWRLEFVIYLEIVSCVLRLVKFV